MKNTEYNNLMVGVGKTWSLRNTLRFELQDKTKEILKLQHDFYTNHPFSEITFQIKLYILNQEKSLLEKLYKKEDKRVQNFK